MDWDCGSDAWGVEDILQGHHLAGASSAASMDATLSFDAEDIAQAANCMVCYCPALDLDPNMDPERLNMFGSTGSDVKLALERTVWAAEASKIKQQQAELPNADDDSDIERELDALLALPSAGKLFAGAAKVSALASAQAPPLLPSATNGFLHDDLLDPSGLFQEHESAIPTSIVATPTAKPVLRAKPAPFALSIAEPLRAELDKIRAVQREAVQNVPCTTCWNIALVDKDGKLPDTAMGCGTSDLMSESERAWFQSQLVGRGAQAEERSESAMLDDVEAMLDQILSAPIPMASEETTAGDTSPVSDSTASTRNHKRGRDIDTDLDLASGSLSQADMPSVRAMMMHEDASAHSRSKRHASGLILPIATADPADGEMDLANAVTSMTAAGRARPVRAAAQRCATRHGWSADSQVEASLAARTARHAMDTYECSAASVRHEDVDDEDGQDDVDDDAEEGDDDMGQDGEDVKGRVLPPATVRILKQWLLSPEHFDFPWPTPEEKTSLAKRVGINERQLGVWLTNARKRMWAPLRRRQGLPIPKYSEARATRAQQAVQDEVTSRRLTARSDGACQLDLARPSVPLALHHVQLCLAGQRSFLERAAVRVERAEAVIASALASLRPQFTSRPVAHAPVMDMASSFVSDLYGGNDDADSIGDMIGALHPVEPLF